MGWHVERMGGWVVNGWERRKMPRDWREEGGGEDRDCDGRTVRRET